MVLHDSAERCSLQSPRKRVGSRSKLFRLGNIVIVVVLSALLGALVSIFGPTRYIVEQLNTQASDLRVQQRTQPFPQLVDVVELQHEHLFRATIKSCLPQINSKCKTFVIPPDEMALHLKGSDKEDKAGDDDKSATDLSRKIERVALIAPPGSIAIALLNQAKRVVSQQNYQRKKQDDSAVIQLIPRSHVPPYGYGKTHGLTKIIRLVPQPLALAVTDALEAMLPPGETYRSLTILDLKAALRQLLRFHCRLSHVAAHTAILSIPSVELVEDLEAVFVKLQEFIAPSLPDNAKTNSAEAQGNSIDDDQEKIFDTQASFSSQLLSFIQSQSRITNIYETMDKVLLDELQLTKNMTVWPCPSFWSVGESTDPLQVNEIIKELASKLSPDCDDPLANCFVARDKCEARGDAICSGGQ